jgi:hypothetical protein
MQYANTHEQETIPPTREEMLANWRENGRTYYEYVAGQKALDTSLKSMPFIS